jgi:hypothetical protein
VSQPPENGREHGGEADDRVSSAAIASGLRAALSLAPGASVSAIRSETLATDETRGLCHSRRRL